MSAPARVPATFFAGDDHLTTPLPFRETEENDMTADDAADTARTESFGAETARTESFGPAGHATEYLDPSYGHVPYTAPDAGGAMAGTATAGTAVETTRRRRFSPALAFAGISSIVIAAWVLLGTPIITQSVVVIGGVALVVLLGLMLIARR